MDNNKEEEVKLYIARNNRRMTMKFIKIYNKMCRPCKALCLENSQRDIDDYCNVCNEMFKKVLGRDVK